TLLGPVAETRALQHTSGIAREFGGTPLADVDPDVSHLIMRHRSGALSTIMASHAVWAYRRTAVELYGSEGTVNLLGDDWDPTGIEVFRADWGHWRSYASPDRTWNWTDGLREAVLALATGSPPAVDLEHDVHIVDVLGAAVRSAADDGRPVPVSSEFGALDLTYPSAPPPPPIPRPRLLRCARTTSALGGRNGGSRQGAERGGAAFPWAWAWAVLRPPFSLSRCRALRCYSGRSFRLKRRSERPICAASSPRSWRA